MEAKLKVSVDENTSTPTTRVIRFEGEFDKAGFADIAQGLRTDMEQLDGVDEVVFDFHNLRFINSEGIGFLVEVHTHLIDQSKKFKVVGVNEYLQDIFNTVGLNDVLSIYPA